ncbi:amidase family protein [Streptomyces mirabilis]|uniref:amidase family protein n=1 Tax=Streptomyces mirabilis TaxID=68239 RepID=UPI0036E06261
MRSPIDPFDTFEPFDPSVFNVTGQPAISIPIHHDDATGMPVGVQIVAAPWREDLLLQVSRTLELAHPWADRRPPVS